MKSLSSALVVLAGVHGMVSAIHPEPVFRFGIPAMVLLSAGAVTLTLGLVGWWACLKYDR